MNEIKNQMKLTFMSVPENVPLARITVATFASQLEFSIEDLEEIKVAASEAVSNCIIHGYKGDPNYSISIVCTIYLDLLEITVEDQGVGIADVSRAMQPAFSTEDDRMGLGFTFMQSFMDKLDVKSSINQGTKVTMVKRPMDVAAVALEEN